MEFSHSIRPQDAINPSSDKFNVWDAMVEDDTNRYKIETERSINIKKLS